MMIQCMKKLSAGGLPSEVLISSKFIQFNASQQFCFEIIIISIHLVIVVSVDFVCKIRLWQSGILLKS